MPRDFFLLFGFSCAYNMTPPSPLKWLLRRFDHASIYLMIAGTYTALLAQLPDHALALTLAGIVWAGASVGIGLKLIWPGRFDNASIIFYLALGWVAIFAVKPLLAALPTSTMTLIAIGGMLYSVGVMFYRWHSLKYPERHLAQLRAGGGGLPLRGHRAGDRRRRLIDDLRAASILPLGDAAADGHFRRQHQSRLT